tara:strand:- start:7 stop:228 length:222 start_codon:yes stop_codon:yes gene_type:complete
MTDNEKKEAIREQRDKYFKSFDAKAIQCLSQGIDIPADWLTYATELRTLTDDVANTTRITEGLLDIIWPDKPS